MLSLAECPIQTVPEPGGEGGSTSSLPTWLQSLNVSITRLNSWAEVDKISQFPGLSDLRIQVPGQTTQRERHPPLTEARLGVFEGTSNFSILVSLCVGGCRGRKEFNCVCVRVSRYTTVRTKQ
jgi:hypothetical protein